MGEVLELLYHKDIKFIPGRIVKGEQRVLVLKRDMTWPQLGWAAQPLCEFRQTGEPL